MVANFNTTVVPALAESLQHLRGTLEGVESMMGPASPFRSELKQAVSELAKAARSMRELAEYLERHPEALVKGKGGN